MAKQITAEDVADKWSRAKARNAPRLDADLDTLEEAGYDVGDARDALEEYTSLERSDYDDAEEFSDARTEAWDLAIDAINDMEAPEIDDTEENIVTTKTATKSTATKSTATKSVAKPAAKPARGKVASKECRVCKITKPLTDFRAKASRPDGHDTLCTDCARAWLANHKAKQAATAKRATKPVATKPVATKPAAKRSTKPVAKTAPAIPAREAAARAKDAKSRVAKVA